MTSARRYAEHLRDDVLLKLFYLGAGFVPVLCISLAGMDVLPLHVSGPTVVLPLCVLMLALGFENRNVGGIALRGLISGVIAVTIYDFIRLSFIHAGLWNDFVPGIGRLLLRNPHAHWLVGYAWRFILNGGCLGIPFAMLGGKGWKAGAGYGVFVCSCLFTTLIISPHAQGRPVRALTAVGGDGAGGPPGLRSGARCLPEPVRVSRTSRRSSSCALTREGRDPPRSARVVVGPRPS